MELAEKESSTLSQASTVTVSNSVPTPHDSMPSEGTVPALSSNLLTLLRFLLKKYYMFVIL